MFNEQSTIYFILSNWFDCLEAIVELFSLSYNYNRLRIKPKQQLPDLIATIITDQSNL